MVVLQSTDEDSQVYRLHWYASELSDVVENGNGVRFPHVTEVMQGKLNMLIDGQPTQELSAGQTITLPVNTSYSFTVIEAPACIICHYSQGEAAEEVYPLRQPRESPRIWPTNNVLNP